METEHSGGCSCGAVRYRVRGNPFGVGICHCADCRKETGSAFTYYAKWPRAGFELTGEPAAYKGRSFCPRCGSMLLCVEEDHVEISLGSLDSAPVGLAPEQEIWVIRREPWLQAVLGRQYDRSP